MRRALAALALCLALPLGAKTLWVVGAGAPLDAPAAAEWLGEFLGEEVQVVDEGVDFLAAWANDPDPARDALLRADTLLVTLPPGEPGPLALAGLRALAARRPAQAPRPLLVAAQKPVYQMSGLCDDRALVRAARLAQAAGCAFAAPPKVWERVYTDDTFYNGRVPKGPRAEAYVLAAAAALALRGADAPLPPFPGLHPEVAEDLVDSIRDGHAQTADLPLLAARLAAPALPLRTGNAFTAVLHDGAFERALGAWLLRLAQADGRDLTLRYTTERDLETGLPCLFRTALPPAKPLPQALLYTRPPFPTAEEELANLPAILRADAAKPNWMPFPLAVAELSRRLPSLPVYDGARPTEPAAAMFAAMVYLRWTGAAVIPADCTQAEALAIDTGLDVALRAATLSPEPNAVLCRPLGQGRYAFSLWRAPKEKVTLALALDDPAAEVRPAELTFAPRAFWQRQTAEAPAGRLLLWKAQPALPGQTTGARETR